MQECDFFSCSELQSHIVSRKKNAEGEKINWFGFRVILYDKDKPFQIKFKCNDEKNQMISIQKKNTTVESLAQCGVPYLFPSGRIISTKKYTDLRERDNFKTKCNFSVYLLYQFIFIFLR